MPNEPMTAGILVVDDEEADLHAHAKALRDGGFEVFTAGGYFDALEVLDRAETIIDVLVAGIVLKLGNGFALARIARLHRSGLKTIHVTGFDDVPTAEADGPVLRKPVSAADLIAAVRAAIAERASAGDD